MRRMIAFIMIGLIMPATSVMAQEKQPPGVFIPQVAKDPVADGRAGQSAGQQILEGLILRKLVTKPDYQEQVINDPRYTSYGRANAVKNGKITQIQKEGNATPTEEAEQTQEEADAEAAEEKEKAQEPPAADDEQGQVLRGNSVQIYQEGEANVSHVSQSGEANSAVQYQKGRYNSLYIEQVGKKNQSDETQLGEQNHKVKIQRSAE